MRKTRSGCFGGGAPRRCVGPRRGRSAAPIRGQRGNAVGENRERGRIQCDRRYFLARTGKHVTAGAARQRRRHCGGAVGAFLHRCRFQQNHRRDVRRCALCRLPDRRLWWSRNNWCCFRARNCVRFLRLHSPKTFVRSRGDARIDWPMLAINRSRSGHRRFCRCLGRCRYC